jgi:hypothetical protein
MAKILQKSMSLKLQYLAYSLCRLDKKRGGEKMKVSSIMLLKTNGEKMSVFWLSIMLLKKHEL